MSTRRPHCGGVHVSSTAIATRVRSSAALSSAGSCRAPLGCAGDASASPSMRPVCIGRGSDAHEPSVFCLAMSSRARSGDMNPPERSPSGSSAACACVRLWSAANAPAKPTDASSGPAIPSRAASVRKRRTSGKRRSSARPHGVSCTSSDEASPIGVPSSLTPCPLKSRHSGGSAHAPGASAAPAAPGASAASTHSCVHAASKHARSSARGMEAVRLATCRSLISFSFSTCSVRQSRLSSSFHTIACALAASLPRQRIHRYASPSTCTRSRSCTPTRTLVTTDRYSCVIESGLRKVGGCSDQKSYHSTLMLTPLSVASTSSGFGYSASAPPPPLPPPANVEPRSPAAFASLPADRRSRSCCERTRRNAPPGPMHSSPHRTGVSVAHPHSGICHASGSASAEQPAPSAPQRACTTVASRGCTLSRSCRPRVYSAQHRAQPASPGLSADTAPPPALPPAVGQLATVGGCSTPGQASSTSEPGDMV